MNKVFCISLMMFPLLFCHAEILQVNTMDEVFRHFKDADSKTLAVFDVDMVLIQPKEPAFQMANIKRHSLICKRVMQNIPEEKRMIFLSLMTTSCDSVLLDSRLPDLLSQLNQNLIPAMALTANLTGKFGPIENMETWRVAGLRQLGIDFSKKPHRIENRLSFPTFHPIVCQWHRLHQGRGIRRIS